MPKNAPSKNAADPFGSLEQDHRFVEELFERMADAKTGAARWTLFLQIKEALGNHAVLEEHIVYPALRSCPATEAQVAATEGYDEHEDIKGTLAEIEMTAPEDGAFVSACTRLEALVGHHVAEEEAEMFPRGRKSLAGKRLEDLGARLAATRAQQAKPEAKKPTARHANPAAPKKR